MIWIIAKKEVLLNLMTFKFAVGTILCVVLMAVFMPVLVGDYQQRLKDYNENISANEAELRKVHVYKNITPTVYRPPNVLSVFSGGIDKYLENSEKIGIFGDSGLEMEISETNTLLSVFPALDIALIFKIIISILALLMAYDLISGEKEQGTLKLILSNTTARYQVLLGKVIAGLMTLVVPVTVSFIVGLLILVLSAMVSITGTEWFRIVLMYFTSLIFVSVMFNLGLLLSCLSKNSATSLVFGLFLWLFFAAIFPNASTYIASQLKPIESAEEFDGKLKVVTDNRDGEINELTKDIKGGGNQSQAPGAFNKIYDIVCDRNFREYHQKRYRAMEPIKIKYIDKMLNVKEMHQKDLIKQKQLADNIACGSPIILYESLMSVLAGTDFGNIERFKGNVKVYRNEVVDYIRAKTESFTTTSYFTPCKEGAWGEFMSVAKPYLESKDAAIAGKAMEVLVERYNQMIKETPSLDLHDFPKFTYKPLNVTESFQQAIPVLMLLIFASILFFLLSYIAFLKYDIR